MPLRVWRTDEVTPLSPHPNDPGRRTEKPGPPAPESDGSEFLTTFTVAIPVDTVAETVDATNEREADRARELAEQGHLERLWALPGEGRALGLWQASDLGGMNAILTSLPLYAWMSVQTTPLTPHPSDPALIGG
jgi:muconolactone delta-isomerase